MTAESVRAAQEILGAQGSAFRLRESWSGSAGTARAAGARKSHWYAMVREASARFRLGLMRKDSADELEQFRYAGAQKKVYALDGRI